MNMLEVGNVLVAEDILTEQFACHLTSCKGECCVQGDSGAPLLQTEVGDIERVLSKVLPYLTPEGADTIAQNGVSVHDADGDLTTTCIGGNKACAFTIFDKGIVFCGIEKAYRNGETDFHKPISCHLYPIRITTYPDFDALHYDRWHICAPACSFGAKEKIRVYEFLKDPLIRKYGEAWYAQLEEMAKQYLAQKSV